jgi:hypothetical protein
VQTAYDQFGKNPAAVRINKRNKATRQELLVNNTSLQRDLQRGLRGIMQSEEVRPR